MGFQDLVSSDLDGLILNASELGETVTYYPMDAIDRSIVVIVFNDEQPMNDNAATWIDEEIRIVCNRSATTGIDNPQFGDTIVRAAGIEPDQRPYAFEGSALAKTRDRWTLTFKRQGRVTHGAV